MSGDPFAAAAEAADFGQPAARKTGRDPRWPYVPVIVGGIAGQAHQTKQLLGRAFVTRGEAVADAAGHVARLRADLARRLALPQYRALREQHGLPRDLVDVDQARPTSDWTAGYQARQAGARRIPPYPAPDTPPGSPESTSWANRCRAWTAGWDARNLEAGG